MPCLADSCLYAIPAEDLDGADHAYETILDPATGLPYEVPLDPATGLPYEVPLDPATGLPYETPLDGSGGYKTLTDDDGNYVQGRQGYDGNLTSAGHYSEGHDVQLTTGAGYDGQLTDPDYTTLRTRAERSTQRRPVNVSTVENAVYIDTAHGTARPPTQTMMNAVYAVPMDTGTGGSSIYATPTGRSPPGGDAPTYGAVHDFLNQARRTRSTHVVDDVAYVTTPLPDVDGANYSKSAEHEGTGVYSDMYAEEAVNPQAPSNYILVSAEDPAVQAEVPTSGGEGYVTGDYVLGCALQLKVRRELNAGRPTTVFVDAQSGYQIPLDNNGGYTSELTAADEDIGLSEGYVVDTSSHAGVHPATATVTSSEVGTRSGYVVETSSDQAADRDVAQPGAVRNGAVEKPSRRGRVQGTALSHKVHADVHPAPTLTLSATAPPLPTRVPKPLNSNDPTQLVQAWLQRQITGPQTEKELRSFPAGYFCVRKSTSTADCVVLSLMGPESTVYHYQFKAANGVVQIHPSRKSMVDPTFASHSACLNFYLTTDVSTTGLATHPTVCIPLPPQSPPHGAHRGGVGQGGSQRRSIKLAGGTNLEAGSAIDC